MFRRDMWRSQWGLVAGDSSWGRRTWTTPCLGNSSSKPKKSTDSLTKAHWRSPATRRYSRKWSGSFPGRSRVTPPRLSSLTSRLTVTSECGVISSICGPNLDRYSMGWLKKQFGKWRITVESEKEEGNFDSYPTELAQVKGVINELAELRRFILNTNSWVLLTTVKKVSWLVVLVVFLFP